MNPIRMKRVLHRPALGSVLVSALLACACSEQASSGPEAQVGQTTAAILSCGTDSAQYHSMSIIADIAVAAADEMDRWEPLTDFVYAEADDGTTVRKRLTLSDTGAERCPGGTATGCGKLDGLLSLQDSDASLVPNHSLGDFRNYISTFWSRQKSKEANLGNTLDMNPEPHTLTLVSTDTSSACKVRKTYRADRAARKGDSSESSCAPGVACPIPSSSYRGAKALQYRLIFAGLADNQTTTLDSNSDNKFINFVADDANSRVTLDSYVSAYVDTTARTVADFVYDPSGSAASGDLCRTSAGVDGTFVAFPHHSKMFYCKTS